MSKDKDPIKFKSFYEGKIAPKDKNLCRLKSYIKPACEELQNLNLIKCLEFKKDYNFHYKDPRNLSNGSVHHDYTKCLDRGYFVKIKLQSINPCLIYIVACSKTKNKHAKLCFCFVNFYEKYEKHSPKLPKEIDIVRDIYFGGMKKDIHNIKSSIILELSERCGLGCGIKCNNCGKTVDVAGLEKTGGVSKFYRHPSKEFTKSKIIRQFSNIFRKDKCSVLCKIELDKMASYLSASNYNRML